MSIENLWGMTIQVGVLAHQLSNSNGWQNPAKGGKCPFALPPPKWCPVCQECIVTSTYGRVFDWVIIVLDRRSALLVKFSLTAMKWQTLKYLVSEIWAPACKHMVKNTKTLPILEQDLQYINSNNLLCPRPSSEISRTRKTLLSLSTQREQHWLMAAKMSWAETLVGSSYLTWTMRGGMLSQTSALGRESWKRALHWLRNTRCGEGVIFAYMNSPL